MDIIALKKTMVERQLKGRGIKNEKVLAAFLKVSRHEFIDADSKISAYDDRPLSIGCSQTISQPYMVAVMTELLGLKGRERVLEIGTGCGYQTAILAELAMEVCTVERIKVLADRAKQNLSKLEYSNINFKIGDGSLGVEEFKPYDAIIVTAATPSIPQALIAQLKIGGKIVLPIGERFSQVLTLCQKKEKDIVCREVCSCVFVPLIGKEGWNI